MEKAALQRAASLGASPGSRERFVRRELRGGRPFSPRDRRQLTRGYVRDIGSSGTRRGEARGSRLPSAKEEHRDGGCGIGELRQRCEGAVEKTVPRLWFGRCCIFSCVIFIAVVVIVVGRIMRNELRPVQSTTDSIFITGARAGVGRYAALALNRHGFIVFAGVRHASEGDVLKAQASSPDKLIPVMLDITNNRQITVAADAVAAHVGERGLTALFHTAGVDPSVLTVATRSLAVEATPLETFRWVMEVEYFGVIALTQACLRLLERAAFSGRPGRIVFNSDVKVAAPYLGHTFGALAATDAVAMSLREELAEKGTGVDVVVMPLGGARGTAFGAILDAAAEGSSWTPSQAADQPSPHAAAADDLVKAVLARRPWRRYYPGYYLSLATSSFLPGGFADAVIAFIRRR